MFKMIFMGSRTSGKTKGAGSYLSVKLVDLNSVLRPEATVIVSRKFAEALSLGGERTSGYTNDILTSAQQIEVKQQEDIDTNVSVRIDDF